MHKPSNACCTCWSSIFRLILNSSVVWCMVGYWYSHLFFKHGDHACFPWHPKQVDILLLRESERGRVFSFVEHVREGLRGAEMIEWCLGLTLYAAKGCLNWWAYNLWSKRVMGMEITGRKREKIMVASSFKSSTNGWHYFSRFSWRLLY